MDTRLANFLANGENICCTPLEYHNNVKQDMLKYIKITDDYDGYVAVYEELQRLDNIHGVGCA